MATYESRRAAAVPSDVTPELFLYSVFQEHGMVDDLKIVAREMMLRQPDNAEIQQLGKAALAARCGSTQRNGRGRRKSGTAFFLPEGRNKDQAGRLFGACERKWSAIISQRPSFRIALGRDSATVNECSKRI